MSSSLLSRITDVHCHPTDSDTPDDIMNSLPLGRICAMSSRAEDQSKVADLATKWPERVVPCFGWHPWFTHLISLDEFSNVKSKRDHYAALFSPASSQEEQEFSALLSTFPDPTPLSSILSSLRSNLLAFPNAMLGEVGLDRAFRIPLQPYGSEGPGAKKQLSLFGVPLEHQLAILEAQIGIAVELGRNVSLHSVKSPSITVDLLKRMRERYQTRWERISVDLHSCGLSPEIWNGIERNHANVYLSLSIVINSRSPNHTALIRSCSPSRILAESDHIDMSQSPLLTWEMVQTIARVKGWSIEDGTEGVVSRLERNWDEFVRGGVRKLTAKKGKGEEEVVRI